MSGAELAARITAARAVAADFGRADDGYLDHGGTRPDYSSWAHRLASALGGLLPMIGHAEPQDGQLAEMAGTRALPPGWQSTMRQALRDAIGYCGIKASGPGSGEFLEQIGLYQSLARELGIEVDR